MLSLVAGGVGIAIVPTSRMALRPVGGVPAAGRQERLLDMALAWRTDNSPQLVQRFVALVRELCCRNGTTRSHGRNSAAAPAPG
jgi:DNA-binding transcriptional LysR family regulator